MSQRLKNDFQSAFEKNVLRRAIYVALIVGIILNLINQGQNLIHLNFSHINYLKLCLTFMVPYLVSTYSSVLAKRSFEPGEHALHDVHLECATCKKTEINLKKNEIIPECTNCGVHTNWKISRKSSSEIRRMEEELKSKALFMELNPAPVMRIDENGIIQEANQAANLVFNNTTLASHHINEVIPEAKNIDIIKTIQEEKIINLVHSSEKKSFRFEIRGIRALSVCQIYGADISEIINAQKESIKYIAAIEQSYNSIMVTDVRGNIEFVNHAFEEHSGYTTAEVIGKNPRILKSGKFTSAEEYANLWETITLGNVWRGEFHNKKKNGELYWELATISPVKNKQNEIISFLAVKEDITDQKEMQRKIDSMAMFARLNPEPVFRVNAKGIVLDANIAANEAFQKESLTGEQVKKLLPILKDFDFQGFINESKNEIVTDQVDKKTFRFMLKGVKELEVCQIYGSNISKRVEAEKEAQSMALFAKLNPEPVFRFDASGDILQSNPAANEAFKTENLVGNNIQNLITSAREINIKEFIEGAQIKTLTEIIDEKIFRFILRGLPDFNVCQIYGSDITERVKQQEKILEQKKNITRSIEYASRIQNAVLPSLDLINFVLPENFIIYKPRDIVSGDFYWLSKKGKKVVLAAADCTGHGVPGAFMSMLGISFLNEIINKQELIDAGEILNQLRNNVKSTLSQTGKEGEAKDGMDIALCILDFENFTIQYAGAYNPLYLYRNNELIETKADKMPIGIYAREKDSFTSHMQNMNKGDVFYIFSDGFVDQFGGEKGHKFKAVNFKNLLLKIHSKTMRQQKEIIEKEFDNWKGNLEQVDDILVIGFRIT